jgi:hypothetical protein
MSLGQMSSMMLILLHKSRNLCNSSLVLEWPVQHFDKLTVRGKWEQRSDAQVLTAYRN